MEILSNIFVDSLNGFPVAQIPLFLFQMLCAGLIGYLVQFIINKKSGEKIIHNGATLALSIAVLTSIVKYSLPFSVMAAAALLLFLRGKEMSKTTVVGYFLLAIAGIGCGVGSIIQTVLGFGLIFLVILFTPVKK